MYRKSRAALTARLIYVMLVFCFQQIGKEVLLKL